MLVVHSICYLVRNLLTDGFDRACFITIPCLWQSVEGLCAVLQHPEPLELDPSGGPGRETHLPAHPELPGSGETALPALACLLCPTSDQSCSRFRSVFMLGTSPTTSEHHLRP